MSLTQFVTVGASILVMLVLDVPVVWMPFGSLLVANVASSMLGVIVSGGIGRWDIPDGLQWRMLVERGRWLLGQAIVLPGATFVAAAVITAIAGAVAIGYGEAARLVGQPVLVLSTGLSAVLGPRVMAAAIGRDDARGRRLNHQHAMLVVCTGAAYLLFAGWDVAWNPMSRLVPSAYAVAGLAAVSIVAAVASALVFLRVEELMGAHREVDLVKVSIGASLVAVLVAFSAPWTEAFAFPLSLLAMSATRYLGYRYYRHRFYHDSSVTQPSSG
jgi:O-antigen/teichoic acid export membrane protein